METTVRHATLRDLPVVAAMLDAFNQEFSTPTPGAAAVEARLRALFGRDDVAVLVAAEPVAGLALLTLRPTVWETGPAVLLEELYVRPEQRNRGLGGELLEAAVALAAEKGATTLEINVDEEDVDAQRFYRRHGFTEIQPETGGRALYFQRTLQR
jgi:ribosomal protein S18 acetylase RimI-like enzyme